MLKKRQQLGLRCRSVIGNYPGSVNIISKIPASRKAENELFQQRKIEARINKYRTIVKENKYKDMASQWELLTDHKVIHNTAQRKVQEAMQQYKMGTDERRQRLRELLEAEEKEYIKEMESMEETTLEREARMRDRLKYLKNRREQERLKLVDEKRDQQFREQSEELRNVIITNTQNQVCAERKVQLQLKEEIQRQQKEEEELFAELWEKDRLAKVEREEENERKRRELNKEMTENLDLQTAAMEAQKAEAKRLIEEEAQLLEEERRFLQLEKERALMKKLQKQQQTKNELDNSVRLKMKRLAKAQQEELALDMKILDQLLHDTVDESQEKLQRKRELNKEDRIYREYLAQQLEEEKRREKDLEMLLEADMKKAWAKQAEQRRREREARKRLMKEVMDTRWIQLQEKLQRNAEKQAELVNDRELLEKAMEEYKQLTMETAARQLKVAKDYQGDLRSQMAYQQKQRDFERAEERREYEEGLLTEKAYQAKLKEILSRPYALHKNIHPLRQSCMVSFKDEHPAKYDLSLRETEQVQAPFKCTETKL